MQRAEWKLDDFSGTKVEDLYDFGRYTFSGEEMLKLESEQKPCNLVFELAVETAKHSTCYKGMARYTSIKMLLIDHQRLESNVNFIKAWTAMNVLLQLQAVALVLEQGCSEDLALAKRGPPYLLSDRECPLQTGHYDSENFWEGKP